MAMMLVSDVGAVGGILHELGLPEGVLSFLLAHAEAVRHQAGKLGLVSPADTGRVLSRHTADSLLFALARAPRPGESWVDVGSGAGFPGLVLACCYPETSFTLVEPMRRRAGFLSVQIASLGVANAVVEPRRSEQVSAGFDVAVARALASPADTLAQLLKLVRAGGTALVGVGADGLSQGGAKELLLARPGVDSPGRFLVAQLEPEPRS
jgi:16S rRNA (guanine527-N7)-methyltransferase